MTKRLLPQAIRVLMSANLLYDAIFLKFAGAPGSVGLFNQMSQAVHGLVSQTIFRLGSGMFETVVAVLTKLAQTRNCRKRRLEFEIPHSGRMNHDSSNDARPAPGPAVHTRYCDTKGAAR